jgi:hypothetical protein
MGVDFTAIVDFRVSEVELSTLPDHLNGAWRLPDILAPWVAEHVCAGSTRWAWKREMPAISVADEIRAERRVWLDGPDGFHGRVFQHALELGHLARWWSFLYEPGMRVGLELACRNIAATVGAEHIVYIPDSGRPPSLATELLYEGGTVSEMLRWLRSEVGAPVSGRTFSLSGSDENSAWFYEHRAG